MDLLSNIQAGFEAALTPQNILFVLIGVVLGTVIGLLPGLGSATGVAILLPLTLSLEPLTGLIMLAGIYYGSQYGGSITAILINTPGDSSQVVTALDGYPMAQRGRAGPAIAIAAISSFVAGTITIPILMIMAPTLGVFALRFGPPEEFALALFGLVAIAGLSGGSVARSMAMAALGVLCASVGLDPQTGVQRYVFGEMNLLTGLDMIAVIIGVFALGQVLIQLGHGHEKAEPTRIRGLWPSREELRRSIGPTGRSSLLGFGLGVLPGAGATVASFMSYGMERRLSRRKEEFGKGAIEGVAGPEAANNAAVNGSFVPTLTLGIPGSATTAILLGALLVYGVQPGPFFMKEHADLAWGLMASFYIGNVALLILNLPLAPVFAQLLKIRYIYLYPVILIVSILGSYATTNNAYSMSVTLAFAGLALLLAIGDYPVAPLILGLVLGKIMEPALSQTSRMAGGDLTILLHRPISATLMIATAVVAVAPFAMTLIRKRFRAATRLEEDTDA